MSHIPSVMRAAADRLSGYSSTIRKVSPMSKADGLLAGDTIRFLLPASSLCDLRTLKLHFNGTTKSADSNGVVLFPSGITSVIDQIVISCNGVAVETTPAGYGALVKMLEDFTVGREQRDARKLMQNESIVGFSDLTSDFFTFHSKADDTTLEPFPLLKPGLRQVNQAFVIDEFPGCLLGTIEPRVQSTAILGDVMVEYRLAPNSILIASKLTGTTPTPLNYTDTTGYSGVAPMAIDNTTAIVKGTITDAAPVSPSYQLDGAYLSVKTLDLAGSDYYSSLKSQIEAGPVSMPYQHWIMQPGTLTSANVNQTSRVTVNSSDVNLILATFQPADFAANTVQPGGTSIGTSPAASTGGCFGNSGTSRYFQRGSVDSTQVYAGTFSINNVTVGYPADLGSVWSDVKDEFALGRNTLTGLNPRIRSVSDFAKAHFVQVLRLNMLLDKNVPESVRALTGLDSRESTLQILWTTTGATVGNINVIPQLWVGSTALLQVGAGRAIKLTA